MLDRVRLLRGENFQQFCGLLLSLDSASFQAVNGAGGDMGNDGFLIVGDTLFQAYGPERESFGRVREKVNDSLSKAEALRAGPMPRLQRLIFLTPFDMTHEMHMHMQIAATAARFSVESWGETKLTGLLGLHPSVRKQFPDLLLPDVLDEIRRLREEQTLLLGKMMTTLAHGPSLSALIRIIVPAPLWFSLNLFNAGKRSALRAGVLVRARPPSSLFSWPLDDPNKTRFFGSDAPEEKIMYQSTDEIVIHPTMGKKVVDVRTTYIPPPGFVMRFAVTLFALDAEPVEAHGSIAAYGKDNLLFLPSSADPRTVGRESPVVETVTVSTSADQRVETRGEIAEYDPSVAAARALNPVLTPGINAAVAEAARSGRAVRIVVVDTEDGRPLPPDWKPPIGVIEEDEAVLMSAPLPPDVRPGVVLLVMGCRVQVEPTARR